MGGNVFDSTSPIKKEHIKPTLEEFYKELSRVFPKAETYFSDSQMEKLGSVGKKDYSGDIDLALSFSAFKNIKNWGLDKNHIDQLFEKFAKRATKATKETLDTKATKEKLTKRAIITAMGEKIEEQSDILKIDLKSSAAGSIFFAFPQFDEQGNEIGKNVQIDVNVGDVDWLSFAYYSDEYKDNVKGLHRTQLMLSLFLIKGYSFSHNSGVTNKQTKKIVARNSKKAIELLNRLYGFKLDSETLQNYFELQKFLRSNLSKEELNKLYSAYIMILDRTRADIPLDLQNFWIKNQERLGLKGKFLPNDSKLKQYATVQ